MSTARPEHRRFRLDPGAAVWGETKELSYLLYPPAGKGDGSPEPLLIFLHGAGERGDDLSQVRRLGVPRRLDEGLQFPAFTVAPQCPSGRWWEMEPLDALLQELERELPIDPDRIAVTGVSMGGYGAWALAAAFPGRFAALAPVCGGGDPRFAERIAHLPHWVFHGAEDEIVPPSESRRMVDALRAEAADVRFTLYEGVGHEAWTPAYREAELFPWLLSARRCQPGG